MQNLYAYNEQRLHVNLSAFVYRLFHEDFSPTIGNSLQTNTDKLTSVIKLSVEHFTMCDSSITLNYVPTIVTFL